MSAVLEKAGEAATTLPDHRSILVAADSSDHSNHAYREAIRLARLSGGAIAGTHVYAAKMHDARFRQMEGGLPEPYREEDELERQRDVHDTLITRGLSVITDSYLDQIDAACEEAGIDFTRRSLEGKNYRRLTEEASRGGYDLLVLGSQGVGAIEGGRLGTVCQRVARRVTIDCLVIKSTSRSLADGPLVVGVDGSPRSYGALITALNLAAHFGSEVKVVAAFDPYYHYVAFNRISGVLSEEAGEVFRFEEQEKLHEDIIDAGLARIYQGHLEVAEQIARAHGAKIETRLLDGKPHDAIARYVRKVDPSLLLIGRLGVHADPDLDIGGNAEHLLSDVDCSVLMTERMFHPEAERVAEITTSWTREAEARMEKVPEFVRAMARTAILRFAHARGHTVITERIVEEATAMMMPGRGGDGPPPAATRVEWSEAALARLDELDEVVRPNMRLRAEKRALAASSPTVEPEHVTPDDAAEPVAGAAGRGDHQTSWDAAALARLARVPQGFCRSMTRTAVERFAAEAGVTGIDLPFVEQIIGTFKQGSAAFESELEWDPAASERIGRAPEMVRGMLVREIEGHVRRQGRDRVDEAAVVEVRETWRDGGVFHLGPDGPG